MKKTLLALAVALSLAACGQQDNKEKEQVAEQAEPKPVMTPPMPLAPQKTPAETQILQEPERQNPNGPVLSFDEGRPLDLSKMLGGQKKSVEEIATEMIDTIRAKAEQGDAEYQYLYGASLDRGWGVKTDHKEALAWLEKASRQGQKASFNYIGNMYRAGQGVQADPVKAKEWYEKGAEAKDAQAMLNLGNCHFYGVGTEKDLTQALKWWEESARYGNPYAMAQMGDCYFFGKGVEKDIDKAVEYLEKAVEREVPGAQYRLGILYYEGYGVKKDLTYSELLMKKARDGGMQEAQTFLDRQF